MKVVIIFGSVREARQGHKAANFIQQQCIAKGWETSMIDPKVYMLPFIDLMYKEMTNPEPVFKELHDTFVAADGFILVTAEYNHGIPPALKNILDHYQPEYFFKPSGLVSYSAGYFGGARAVEHLRCVCAELGMPSIPIAYHIPNIAKAMGEDGTPTDPAASQRVQRFLSEFGWYMKCMKQGREEGTPY